MGSRLSYRFHELAGTGVAFFLEIRLDCGFGWIDCSIWLLGEDLCDIPVCPMGCMRTAWLYGSGRNAWPSWP